MIRFDVRIDPKQFSDIAINAMRDLVLQALTTAQRQSITPCRRIFRESLRRQKEYDSLLGARSGYNNNPLKSAFGLTDDMALSAVDSILDASENMLKISVIPPAVGKRGPNQPLSDFGGLRIVLVPEDISMLYGIGGTSYTSTSKRGAFNIPWLNWLLERGQSTLISDFYPLYGSYPSDASRSREAIMVPSGGSSKKFEVSRTYAGKRGNNWITRAANSCLPKIEGILTEFVMRNLK